MSYNFATASDYKLNFITGKQRFQCDNCEKKVKLEDLIKPKEQQEKMEECKPIRASKDEISKVIYNDQVTKQVSDYALNYFPHDKTAYRVKRYEVLVQSYDEPFLGKERPTEYAKHYTKKK